MLKIIKQQNSLLLYFWTAVYTFKDYIKQAWKLKLGKSAEYASYKVIRKKCMNFFELYDMKENSDSDSICQWKKKGGGTEKPVVKLTTAFKITVIKMIFTVAKYD